MKPCALRIAFALAWAGATLQSPAFAQGFVNVTVASGISVPAWSGNGGYGRGSAWADFDGDGWIDLFAAGGPNQPIRLFRGLGNGSFQAPQIVWPAAPTRRDHGVTAVDFDNDGDVDVYVCVGLQQPNLLFVNDGSGNFSEAAGAAGIAGAEDSYGATFGDYDRDGFLDLYVGNLLNATGSGAVDRLYRNLGNGSFVEVTATAIGPVTNAQTLTALFCDFDQDGWPDIWVGHDRGYSGPPNVVYRNDHDGTFTDVALAINARAPIACMGITQGDIHNDGHWDVFCTNEQAGHVLQVWDPATSTYLLPNGDYFATAVTYGVAAFDVGWSCRFFDYDNDGWNDLYITHSSASPTPNHLYRGTGTAPFTNVSASSGFGFQTPPVGSSAFVDFDDDGDLDFYSAGDLTAAQLVRNDAATGNWIRFQLTGTRSNRDAIGAVVILRHGSSTQRRMVTSGEGFLSECDRRVHFGIGTATQVDEVEIRWPSGSVQFLDGPAVNQTHAVTEPDWNFSAALAPGTAVTAGLIFPANPGPAYLHLISLWTAYETPLGDGRILRATAADPFLQASLDPGNGVLFGNSGPLVAPYATGSTLILPAIPAISGLPLNWIGLSIDPTRAAWIKNIVGPRPVTIQ